MLLEKRKDETDNKAEQLITYKQSVDNQLENLHSKYVHLKKVFEAETLGTLEEKVSAKMLPLQ